MKVALFALVLVGAFVLGGCSSCNKCQAATPCGCGEVAAPCTTCDK